MRGHTRSFNCPPFPTIEADLGYNPARWLHTRSPDGKASGQGSTPELAPAYAIIAGISDRWELAWWAFVETRTRRRDHVFRHLRRRDIAIVTDQTRFADTGRYPWERASEIVDSTSTKPTPTVEPEPEPEPTTAAPSSEAESTATDGGTDVAADTEPYVCEEHNLECSKTSVGGQAAWFCERCGDFVARIDASEVPA